MKKEQFHLVIGIATPLLLVTVLLIQLHHGQQNLTRAIIQLHTGRPVQQEEVSAVEPLPESAQEKPEAPGSSRRTAPSTPTKPADTAANQPVSTPPQSSSPPPNEPKPQAKLEPIPGELIENNEAANLPNGGRVQLTYSAVAMPVIINHIYPRLQNFGSWFFHPRHGRVWMPHASRRNQRWRPYGDKGQWHYTQNGWHWQSDYKWGGTTFHHGRWFWDDEQNGWAWVPGQEWSPAWVTWRDSGDRIGWAPIPPTKTIARAKPGSPGSSRVHVDYNLDSNHYTFIPKVDFLSPNPVDFALGESDALAAFESSRLRDRIRRTAQNKWINLGIPRPEMAQAIGSPIETYFLDFREPYQPRVVTLQELENIAAQAQQQSQDALQKEQLERTDGARDFNPAFNANRYWSGNPNVGFTRAAGQVASPNAIVIDGSTQTTNKKSPAQATNAGGMGFRRGQARPNLSVRQAPTGQ